MRLLRSIIPIIFFLGLIAGLAACGSSTPTNDPIPIVEIVIDNSTFTVEEDGLYDLHIFGDGNTVGASPPNTINSFVLIGSNNQVTFERGATVGTFEITGNDNTVLIPRGSGITFNAIGSGNMLIEY